MGHVGGRRTNAAGALARSGVLADTHERWSTFLYTRLTAPITHPTPHGIGYLGPGIVVETDAAGEEVWLRAVEEHAILYECSFVGFQNELMSVLSK